MAGIHAGSVRRWRFSLHDLRPMEYQGFLHFFLFFERCVSAFCRPPILFEVFGSGKQTGQYGSPWSRRQTWPHSGQQRHSRIGNVQTGQMSVLMVCSFPKHVEEQHHFLKMSGQPPCFSLRSLVQRR